MSKLQNHVRALPSSAFFLARTANCLWKASLDRVQAFSFVFSTMASDELQSILEMEQIMSYLRMPQADVQTGTQSMRSDLQSLSDRLQKVEEEESKSQTSPPSPHPAQRASTDVLPSLPSSSRLWADRVEQEEDDDAFKHSIAMDRDVKPGDDAKGIRIFPLEEATESFLSQLGFVLAPTQSGQEATAGVFLETKPPQGNDSPAGQCDASTDVVSSQGKRQ